MSKPDLVFDESVATGWAKVEVYGNRPYNPQYIKAGRKLLGHLRHQMGVNQRITAGEPGGFYYNSTLLDDGTQVYVQTNNGFDTIRITSDYHPVDPKDEKKLEGRPDEFFAVCGEYFDADGYPYPFQWQDGVYTAISFPDGGYHYGEAKGISWDGTTVCGTVSGDEISGDDAFIWKKGVGTTLLPRVGSGQNIANAISADGSVVAGAGDSRGFTWSASGGLVLMSELESDVPSPQSGAHAITADGALAAGWSWRGNGHGSAIREAIIWDSASGGMVTVLPLSGDFDTFAGDAVVGGVLTKRSERRLLDPLTREVQVTTIADYYPATYNTAGYILVYLGNGTVRTDPNTERYPRYPHTVIETRYTYTENPPGAHAGGNLIETIDLYKDVISWNVPHGMTAYGVSFDGAIVVGASGPNAFRWTAEGGTQVLGRPAGHSQTEARGISADGTVVVGRTLGPDSWSWFYWTEETGFVEAGSGMCYAASQGGVVAVGESLTTGPGGGLGGDGVIRGVIADAEGAITEQNLTAGPPYSASFGRLNAVTLIEMWRHPDNVTIDYDPEFPGLTLDL